ncbi:MIF domain containing protein [Metarhizium rileyi]|uniref:L-dopachrome isomerase n=1 Tax=Metarhizium rileyi (strain RCEF 4871) TaxID=1649241 RepID=A0A167F609_METRR|nr:MIF domain containing protein [Metarhizium rileyi RCEF 4871]
MADNFSPIYRRAPSPAADGFYVPTPIINDASRRTPSPQLAYSDRRSSQHIRRSSLEPVLEGEVRTLDNRRHTVGHDATGNLPKPNLAKLRVPNSGRASYGSSAGFRRGKVIRSEYLLSVEVKTNVVITNEYLFMNELTYHLSIRYSRPVCSIVVSLQHGICLLFGGSFDPAYIMTITALPDQVMANTNRRNAALFQSHLQQALRVLPTRGLIQFTPITEECLGYGGETLAAAMGASSVMQGSQGNDSRDGEWRSSKSLALRKPVSTTSIRSHQEDIAARPAHTKSHPASLRNGVDVITPSETKTRRKTKGFMHSLFMRPPKELEAS